MQPPLDPDVPIFFISYHWEIIWLYPLLVKTHWPVCPNNQLMKELVEEYGFYTLSREEIDHQHKLIVMAQHFFQHKEMIHRWMTTGGKVYVIQHGWDPALALMDYTWSADMREFTKYLVGCTQDYKWLHERYGDRVRMTGSPRLSMVHQVQKMDLSDIYSRVGTKDFFVATPPMGGGFHREDVVDAYLRYLPSKTGKKIVYKYHPSCDQKSLGEQHPELFFWKDSWTDPYETFKLIYASQGVITPSSFMGIEATLLDKSVILLGDLDPDEYKRQEWQHQIERLPRGMSSDLDNPCFTSKQREVQSWYKFDTESIMNVINEILE